MFGKLPILIEHHQPNRHHRPPPKTVHFRVEENRVDTLSFQPQAGEIGLNPSLKAGKFNQAHGRTVITRA